MNKCSITNDEHFKNPFQTLTYNTLSKMFFLGCGFTSVCVCVCLNMFLYFRSSCANYSCFQLLIRYCHHFYFNILINHSSDLQKYSSFSNIESWLKRALEALQHICCIYNWKKWSHGKGKTFASNYIIGYLSF